MSEFTFSCPACGRAILADTAYAGKDITCPICKAIIVVPKEITGVNSTSAGNLPASPNHNALCRPTHLRIGHRIAGVLRVILDHLHWLASGNHLRASGQVTHPAESVAQRTRACHSGPRHRLFNIGIGNREHRILCVAYFNRRETRIRKCPAKSDNEHYHRHENSIGNCFQ